MTPRSLTLDELFLVHGNDPVRDLTSLCHAIGMVTARFEGVLVHETLFEMAAAYLFHICRNHPFLDRNKRTAVAAALTFLELNGIEIDADASDFYNLVIGVAEGRITKAEVAVFLQQSAR